MESPLNYKTKRESINSDEVRLLFRQFLEEALGVNQPSSNEVNEVTAEIHSQRSKAH